MNDVRIAKFQDTRTAAMALGDKALSREDIQRLANRNLGNAILARPPALDDFRTRNDSPHKNFFAQTRGNALFQQAAWLCGIFLRVGAHGLG